MACLLKAKPTSSKVDALVGQVLRDAVVRHDGRDARVDGGLEGLEVILEPAARVPGELAERVVRIEASSGRPAAREVLDGHRRPWCSDSTGPPCKLSTRFFMMSALRSPLSLKVSCTRNQRGLGGGVGHVGVGAAQANGRPLSADRLAKVADHRHVADRGQPRFLGPLRERPRRLVDALARVAIVVVARVGLEDHRDAQTRGLGELLHLVGELGRPHGTHAGRPDLHCASEDEALHVFVVDETQCCRADQRRPLLGALSVSISSIPAFSSSVISLTRSATRTSTGRRQFSYWSSLPSALRSRYVN